MKQRIITGVVAGAIFIAFLVLGGYFFQLFVGLLTFVAMSEMFKMKGTKFLTFEGILSAIAAMVLSMPFVSNLLNMGSNGPFMLFAFFIFAMLAATVFSKDGYNIENIAFPFLSAFYIGIGFQSLSFARSADTITVLFAVFIVWAGDTGAYFVGRSFGKHKLLPAVSPHKTIEGSIGGVASAVLVSAIMLFFFRSSLPSLPIWELLLLSALFSCVAQLGDLVESSIKRHFAVKDSGKILPGHGGILDRFDSMIFVLPLMHLLGLL
ncbi:phosphatidate cytidylyltransferase [Lactovum miscens]|uniref:Phosphatidate cytidylyltransferase n=1 Tax=Lactovum miscens TaxID=190387 RepID=A0A841C8K0_9LACT|nr:phosphatidate cytidylyltransferase [Lactovum miscens]MBB5888674.1 phosphatidate cytidylyltransferase [Lactovum miscens]